MYKYIHIISNLISNDKKSAVSLSSHAVLFLPLALCVPTLVLNDQILIFYRKTNELSLSCTMKGKI